jgi:glycosyltransferase involved in cell wall biosynthesis
MALPSVSAVVPVLNAPERVRACIEALLAQTYPSHKVQIVVVDNGSDDETPEVVSAYPVELVFETAVKSPYAARNAGIERATGDVIALTDANCVPAANWIEEGVGALESLGADLAGGRVGFTFSTPPSIGEVADALINVDVEASIANHRACMTGNLFVRRGVFSSVGAFETTVRSGGDMRWTRRATDAGFALVFAPDAEVSYPARALGPLLRKQFRVGQGAPSVWRELGMSRGGMVIAAFRGLLPMPPHRLLSKLGQRGLDERRPPLLSLWLTIWLCKITRSLGSMVR